MNFVLDDYEIDDICYDDNLIHIEKIKEEKKDDNGWIELKQGDKTPDHEVIARDSYKNTLIGYVCCEGEGFICESETEVMYDVIKYREIPEQSGGYNMTNFEALKVCIEYLKKSHP